MTPFEFSQQVTRMEGVFGPLPAAVVEELRTRFMGVDACIWVQVCNRVIGSSTYSPRVAAFEAARGVVMAERRQQRGVELGSGCLECGGSRFVTAFYRLVEWPADTFEALKPCRCHPMAGCLGRGEGGLAVEGITAEAHAEALLAKREQPEV